MPLFFRFVMAIFLFAVGFYLDRLFSTGFIAYVGAILGFLFSGKLFFHILKLPLGGLITGGIMGFSISSVIVFIAENVFKYNSPTFHLVILLVFLILMGLFGHLFLSSEGVRKK